jgi:hypothetical protein
MNNILSDAPCVRNDEERVNRFHGLGLLASSITLIGFAAAVNVRHAAGTATGYADIAEAGAFAVAMTVGFVALPTFGLKMAREGARTLAVAAFVGTIICGSVSFTNLVGAAMKHRLTAAVEATDETDKRTDTRRALAGGRRGRAGDHTHDPPERRHSGRDRRQADQPPRPSGL